MVSQKINDTIFEIITLPRATPLFLKQLEEKLQSLSVANDKSLFGKHLISNQYV